MSRPRAARVRALIAAALLLLWTGLPESSSAAEGTLPDSTARAAAAPPPAGSPATGALRVFIDCALCGGADMDYLRTQVAFVDHVRDPATAQVHVLVTGQSTGGGGDEFTLTFLGRARFAGWDDTLRFSTRASDSDETQRRSLAHTIKLGLMRYAARTPKAPEISIDYQGGGSAEAPAADRWHNWVFSTHVSGSFNGQSSSRSVSSTVSQSASRVTPERKFGLTVSGNYRENRYTLSDGSTLLSISRYREAAGRHVWSLGDHWSTMARARAYSSTFENVDLQIGAGGGLEYNVFPYSQSTRRQLRIDYTAGARRVRYFQPTTTTLHESC